MKLHPIEVRTSRNSLVCRVTRYLASLDLLLKEFPPERGYSITILPPEAK